MEQAKFIPSLPLDGFFFVCLYHACIYAMHVKSKNAAMLIYAFRTETIWRYNNSSSMHIHQNGGRSHTVTPLANTDPILPCNFLGQLLLYLITPSILFPVSNTQYCAQIKHPVMPIQIFFPEFWPDQVLFSSRSLDQVLFSSRSLFWLD